LVDVSIRGAPYRDGSGKLAGSVSMHRDISELKRLEKEVIDIGDKERQKIGHDLHDDLCPHLIGIEGLGTVLKRKLEARGMAEAAQMGKINDLLKEAIVKSRQYARGLCPVYLVDHGLVAALREFADNVRCLYGVGCTFRCESEVILRDNTVATHIFRIVQEAVNNAARHAAPRQIHIELSCVNGRLKLTVGDDGVGVPEDRGSTGMGLRIMAFRATMIQASLEVKQGGNGGTVVQLQMNI
jgi:signal transduction histidine kinase